MHPGQLHIRYAIDYLCIFKANTSHMKRSSINLVFMFSLVLAFGGCVTNKKLTYLQYNDRSDQSDFQRQDPMTSVTPPAYKIMPYDVLFIRVITPDPTWSELFNTTAVGQGGALTMESASLVGYPVDREGFIDIPYVGRVKVSDKTVSEIKTDLDDIFSRYLNDAAITVRLVNNYISVIGEVGFPGRYPLTKESINIFEALSMAGDLNDFGNRQKVQLIRPTLYGPMIREFSLNDRSILTSDLYYLMPNDIIYAKPMRGRSFQVNATTLTTLLTALTTTFVIIGYFR